MTLIWSLLLIWPSKRNHLHRHSRYFCCPRQLRQRIFPWLVAIGMSRAGRLLVAWLRPPRLEGAEFAAAMGLCSDSSALEKDGPFSLYCPRPSMRARHTKNWNSPQWYKRRGKPVWGWFCPAVRREGPAHAIAPRPQSCRRPNRPTDAPQHAGSCKSLGWCWCPPEWRRH